MFLRLLFLLTFIPFLELYFLVKLGNSFGWSKTLLLIFTTGVIGAWLLRKQGHSILKQLQENSRQGQVPSDALAKGLFTFIGGLLLLTPGLLTDALGLSLIFPITQIFWKNYFLKQWQSGVSSGRLRFYSSHFHQENPFQQEPLQRERSDQQSPNRQNVIDIKATSSTTEDKS